MLECGVQRQSNTIYQSIQSQNRGLAGDCSCGKLRGYEYRINMETISILPVVNVSGFLGAAVSSETLSGLQHLKMNIDQFFLIVMGLLVLLMQCGFAFLEAGSVRSKNTTNILMKNFMDSFVAGIWYWLTGYAFAYGSGNSFIGWNLFALKGLPDTHLAVFFFQFVFASTAASIVSGAVAERSEFSTYLIYSFAMTAFVYPVASRWAWSDDGWLKRGQSYLLDGKEATVTFQDFSGSGVVHVVGGVMAFVGAAILGPRIGRFHVESKTVVDLRGHSVPFVALGGFILLFGFLAFNGGSELAISKPNSGASVSLSVVNTVISSTSAAFFTLILHKTPLFGNSSWSLLAIINGSLTGNVAVCAGCNKYGLWGAAIVGLVSAIWFKCISWTLLKCRIDDPLDAVAVHFGGGSWGLLAVAWLDPDTGIFFKWNETSGLKLGWQMAGLATFMVWSGAWSLLVFGLLRVFGILRVSEEIERKGLDIARHKEPTYPSESQGHGHVECIAHVLESGDLQHLMFGSFGHLNKGFNKEISDNTEDHVAHFGFESPEMQVSCNGHVVTESENTHM